MKETVLDNRSSLSRREKGQYALAFSVIAVMLYFVGFPVFLLFFFGILTFFIWKAFSSEPRGGGKQIFEFYLIASEMLRDDDRRWFGFELQEAIRKGEAIVGSMPPPLVYFALGALYQKVGDHASAVQYLSAVAGETAADEGSVMFPSKELRDYARILRKIERSSAEAPLTSSAIRSLERYRKHKGPELLAKSRSMLAATDEIGREAAAVAETSVIDDKARPYDFAEFAKNRKAKSDEPEERRTISEVLQDIYDDKIEG